MKLSIIERLDGKDAALKFIQAHQHFYRFQQLLAEHYLKHNELDELKRLIAGWLKSKSAQLPGIKHYYDALLLQIAEKEGDKAKQIEILRQMLLETAQLEYFDRLKTLVPSADWPETLSGIIQAFKKGMHTEFLLPEIYAREGMWDNLFELATSKLWGIHILEKYRKQLETRYPTQLCDIYEKTVLKMLEYSSDRRTYQQAAQYLSRIKSLGQGERAALIVQDMMKSYPGRRAMIEELKKV